MKKRKLWRVMTACILKRHGIYKKKHWLISLLVGTSKVSTLLLTSLVLPPVSGSSGKRKVIILAASAWISTEEQPEVLNFILTH